MGNSSTGKLSLLPRESDPSKVTPTAIDEMAAGIPGDDTERQINYQQIFEEMDRRYSQAQHGVYNLFDFATSLVNHQIKLEAKNAKYKERLRRGFNENHSRQSESNVENIAGTNRPSVLEMKYKEFCDHERMDAASALEGERTQKKRDKWAENYMDQHIACIIFEESYQVARSLKDNFIRSMDLILMSAPSIGEQYFEQENKKTHEVRFSIDKRKTGSHQQSTISQIRENSLTLIMKETAENCDISALVQRTFTSLGKNQEKGDFNDYSKEFLRNPRLQKYVEECCKFAWKLVCHTPPYEIDGNLGLQKNTLFNDASHQVCRGSTSSERSSRYIVAVIWPGLLRGSPRRVIQKTEVVLSDK